MMRASVKELAERRAHEVGRSVANYIEQLILEDAAINPPKIKPSA
jgi:hypothetical protein